MHPIKELRRRLARTPLWLRLVAGTVLLLIAAITLTGVTAVKLLNGYLVDRVDTNLEIAAGIAHSDRNRDGPPRPPRRLEHVTLGRLTSSPGPRYRRAPGSFYVVLLDSKGDIADTYAAPLNTEVPTLPKGLTPAEVERRDGRPFDVASPDGTRWRAVAVPEQYGLTRVVAINMRNVQSTVNRLAVIVSCVGGAAVLILVFACYWLVRRSLRPLNEIEGTARAIAGGDLSRRVPVRHRRTEMGRLGRAINGMLTQIEAALRAREASETAAREAAEAARRSAVEARRSEERMRRFIADASHELRTPLTSIRGFAELYRHEEVRDLEEASRLLRRVEDEAERMGLLVDDLLLLARLDQQRPLERQPVDVLSLAAGAVLDAQLLAPDREIELARLDDGEGPLVVCGDEARIHQVVGNLVSNALNHTPPGTPFRIGVGACGDTEVLIEVADEGPGLSDEDAEHVFERFYRADPSRSRNGQGGTGLGLSIVAALVDAHGGTISVRSEPGRGASFQVRLPMAGPELTADFQVLRTSRED